MESPYPPPPVPPFAGGRGSLSYGDPPEGAHSCAPLPVDRCRVVAPGAACKKVIAVPHAAGSTRSHAALRRRLEPRDEAEAAIRVRAPAATEAGAVDRAGGAGAVECAGMARRTGAESGVDAGRGNRGGAKRLA